MEDLVNDNTQQLIKLIVLEEVKEVTVAVSHLVFSNQLGRREDQRLPREDTIQVEVYLCIMQHLMARQCRLLDVIKG